MPNVSGTGSRSLNVKYRNLVTDLFKHEQIKTTVAKAKETARLAEKVCSYCAYQSTVS